MVDLHMPETSIVMLKTHHSIYDKILEQSIDQRVLFLIFNASKLLTKIALLKSHENDDFIDFS
jgi:hypothetical protein